MARKGRLGWLGVGSAKVPNRAEERRADRSGRLWLGRGIDQLLLGLFYKFAGE